MGDMIGQISPWTVGHIDICNFQKSNDQLVMGVIQNHFAQLWKKAKGEGEFSAKNQIVRNSKCRLFWDEGGGSQDF